MAGAAGRSNSDDNGGYDVRRHGTPPPRHLQTEGEGGIEQPAVQAVLTGMATGSGGSIPINHMNQVAGQLRDEMSAVRTALDADFNARRCQDPRHKINKFKQKEIKIS